MGVYSVGMSTARLRAGLLIRPRPQAHTYEHSQPHTQTTMDTHTHTQRDFLTHTHFSGTHMPSHSEDSTDLHPRDKLTAGRAQRSESLSTDGSKHRPEDPVGSGPTAGWGGAGPSVGPTSPSFMNHLQPSLKGME